MNGVYRERVPDLFFNESSLLVRRFIFRCLFFSGLLLLPCLSWADAKPSTAPQIQRSSPFINRPDVQLFIREMAKDSLWTPKAIEHLFSQIQPCGRTLPTPSLPTGWERYKQQLVTPHKLQQGLSFWARNSASLAQSEARFGVPASVIVAVIGAGSAYGEQYGRFRVLETLLTQAFVDAKNNDVNKAQLRAFLTLMQGRPPHEIIACSGSITGALGIAGIMPEHLLRYQMQQADSQPQGIIHGEEEAVRLVASMLKQQGWQAQQSIMVRTRGGDASIKKPENVSQLQQVILDTPQGKEYWTGSDNFQALCCYNRSQYFAPGVHILAQALRTERQRLAARVKTAAPWSGIT